MPKTKLQFAEIRKERRKEILDAALKVFAEVGYHNASIDKVSIEAGISKGLMYNYFASKEELLQLLLNSLLDEEVKHVYQSLEGPVNEDTFKNLLYRTRDILKKHPQQWKLYVRMMSQPEIIQKSQARFQSNYSLFFTKALEFFKSKGVENPEMELQYFVTTITGMKMAYINDPQNYPLDMITEKIIEQFIN